MRHRYALLIAAALLLGAVAAQAADPVPLSETKRQLMLELFELSGGERSGQQVMDAMLAQMEQSQGAMIEQLIAGSSGLSAEEQSALREQLAGTNGLFTKFRTRLPERIDFRELMQTVVMPIYDRHFDEPDLREMVAFYRTPAGRKTVSLMPQIAQETMQRAAETLQPRFVELVQEIVAEEAEALARAGDG